MVHRGAVKDDIKHYMAKKEKKVVTFVDAMWVLFKVMTARGEIADDM